MNWGKLAGIALKVVSVIPTAVSVAESFTVPGADKKAAVLKGVRDSLSIAEFVAERDLLDEQDVLAAAGALVDAEVAVRNAQAALQQAIATAKARKVGAG